MSLPNVVLQIQDGGLGAVQAQESNIVVVIGCSESGTNADVSQVYTRTSNLVADKGYGPGVQAAALYIQAGIPTIFVKAASTSLGSCGGVTHTGTGASTLTLTSIHPNDDAEVIVVWDESGTIGAQTPKFRYSLDGGITFSNQVRMGTPGTYLIPHTAITLTFSAATVVAGDTYAFTATGPRWSGSDVTACLAALQAKPQLFWRLIHVVGPTVASDAGSVDTAVQSMAAAFRYTRVICDSRAFNGDSESAWMTSLETDYLSFTSADGRVAIGAGPVRIASIDGYRIVRSVAWLAVRRAMLLTIHDDISNLDESLTGITDITGFTVVYHDENVVQGLDAARFITMRTITGRLGYFITNPNLMSQVGSDYNLLQLGLVADVGCATIRQFFLSALNKPVRIDPETGHILEKDALTLQNGGQAAMRVALVSAGHCSATQTQVARDDNLLTPPRNLTVNEFVVPLGYTKAITITFGFRATIAA